MSTPWASELVGVAEFGFLHVVLALEVLHAVIEGERVSVEQVISQVWHSRHSAITMGEFVE